MPASSSGSRRSGRSLRRMAKEGWVEKLGTTGLKVQWALRERSR